MMQRGIRGATTVENDSVNEITTAVVGLINEMMTKNQIFTEEISHVIFTMTEDLKSVNPAKCARENIEGFNKVPMMCVPELKTDNSLKQCVRVLIVINTESEQDKIKHVYLKEAKKLRVDLTNA